MGSKNIVVFLFLSCALLICCQTGEENEAAGNEIGLSRNTAEFNANGDSIALTTQGRSWWIASITLDDVPMTIPETIDTAAGDFSWHTEYFQITRKSGSTLEIAMPENTGSEKVLIIGLASLKETEEIRITQPVSVDFIAGYQLQRVEGFKLYVEQEALDKHPEETQEALLRIRGMLREITEFDFKPGILGALQNVSVFMDWNTTNGGAVYHPSREWLIANGYIAEKERSIEISNIVNFNTWTEQNQPYIVMHEMAHAYHDQVLGYDYAPIQEAYSMALLNDLYGWVPYHAGNGTYYDLEAYARTSSVEYFAEITEAYLGENDYFPFTRTDLESYDIPGHGLVKEIWGE